MKPAIGCLVPPSPWTARIVGVFGKAVSLLHPDGALVSVVGRAEHMEARAMMPAAGWDAFAAGTARALDVATRHEPAMAIWDGTRLISGTLFGKKDIRIVEIDGYRIDVTPEGTMLVAAHNDKPGIIGQVGTLLGNKKINIAGMHVGRQSIGKRAIMVLNVDDLIPANVMAEIVNLDGIESAKQVKL